MNISTPHPARPRMIGACLAFAAALTLGGGAADARTVIAVGVGAPVWYGPPRYVYEPVPVYVAPPVQVISPPPVYVAPPVQVVVPPAQVVAPPPQMAPPPPSPAPAQYWYYCDNPQGYYPYVTSCAVGWRQVLATPPK